MERKDVDRATLASNGKRHFDRGAPAGFCQNLQGQVNKGDVALMQQPIEPLALPEQPDMDAGAERRGNADQGVDGDPIGSTALDPPKDRA